jgi:hypothetical protein
MGIGAVVHTLNPRLSDHDLTYIINHAGDAYIAVDVSLAPILQRILKDCPSVRGVIILTDRWVGWRGGGCMGVWCRGIARRVGWGCVGVGGWVHGIGRRVGGCGGVGCSQGIG